MSELDGATAVSPQSVSVPVLVDFLNTVPTPLTAVLVGLAPYISRIRYTAEAISWKSSWVDSWLALAGWWAVCLLAELGLRYFLPIAILFVLVVIKWTSHPRTAPPPITEHNLQATISDLTTIHSLIPAIPPLEIATATVLARVSAILYLPYLLLTYFVSLRVLVGLFGTLLLSWRASWARTIRYRLWRSAWVRWSVYYAWSVLVGQPLPPMTLSLQPTSSSAQPVNSTRFLFTIHENQRWWVGLDWTAVLLPAERPSWCSASQHPVSPPNAFALPDNTTVFVEDGRGGRVKRTATWRWEESEWKVLLRKDGGGTSRIEKQLPSATTKEDSPSRIRKMTGKIKEITSEGSSGSTSIDGKQGLKVETEMDDSEEPTTEEPSTDADGWVYCGNKWEAPSSKGAMNKFTRYRRWTRIAIVSELVEVVEIGGVGIQRSPSVGSRSTDTDVFSPTSANAEDWPEAGDGAEGSTAGSTSGSTSGSLRQRAKFSKSSTV